MARSLRADEGKVEVVLKNWNLYNLNGFFKPLLFCGWYRFPRDGFEEEDAAFFSEAGLVYFTKSQLKALAPTPSVVRDSQSTGYAQSQPK